jgi:UDP-glucose:(heptosyl)LPS alpha-1,3-glucosyltransferase
MKLAICISQYFPYGGLQRDFLRVAQTALQRGHDVDIYTMSWSGEFLSGARINFVPDKGWSNHAKIHHFSRYLAKSLAEKNYDVVLGFERMPGLSLYFAGDFCFSGNSKNHYPILRYILPRYRKFQKLESAVFSPKSSTKIISINEEEKKVYQLEYKTPSERFIDIPPAIDWQQFVNMTPVQRSVFRDKFSVSDDEFCLLFVGSDFDRKGLDRVFIAMAALPAHQKEKVKLLVAGQGSERFFRGIVKRLDLVDKVIYLGPQEDVQQLMMAADLLMHPARLELGGKVLIEALQVNTPAITTKVCGCARWVLEAEAGVVLGDPFSQEELNIVLANTLKPGVLQRYSDNARAYEGKDKFFDSYTFFLDAVENSSKRVNHYFYVADQVKKILPDDRRACIEKVFSFQGKEYRLIKDRKTIELSFNNKDYFVKTHAGVGWHEIIKNLCYFRPAVLGAKNEFKALRYLSGKSISVPKLVAYASKGNNPARKKSFVMMEKVIHQLTLEDLILQKVKLSFCFKRALIKRVAQMVREMHQAGVNHRDCYLCHFLLNKRSDDDFDLTLIDWHRAEIRNKVPRRWLEKDLAGLYFSAMDARLTRNDKLYFLCHYHQLPLKKFVKKHAGLWRTIEKKAAQLYNRLRVDSSL